MVGVKRSRGCLQCKRRKKGCDLAQPTCTQCSKAGLQCVYQEKQWTFRHQQLARAKPVASGKTYDNARHYQDESLTLTALKIQVIGDFWTRYFPQDGEDVVYVPGIADVSWRSAVQRIAAGDTATLTALQACAFMTLGRLDRHRAYVRHAMQLYVQSLRETNMALQDPKKVRSDETLACCKLLVLFENFRLDEEGQGKPSTQGTDWQRHIQGSCRIMELRGPEMAAESSIGNDFFQDVRLQAAISGFVRRKASPFTTEAWRTIPWRHRPRTLRDELVDLMSDLPAILERQDAPSSPSQTEEEEEQEARDVLDQCIELSHRLQAWERKTLRVAQFPPPTPITLSSICESHGLAFFFTVTQYWMTCLALYSTTFLLTIKHPSLMEAKPDWMIAQPYASIIAQHASHFFIPEAGIWGAQVSTTAIGMALHYYAATGQFHSSEMKLLRAALADPGKASMSSDFLRSIAADAYAPGGGGGGDASASAEDHQRMASAWYGTGKKSRRRRSADGEAAKTDT